MLLKTSGCSKSFNKNKSMSSMIKDNELLKKYNKIWDRVSNCLKKQIYSEPVYNEKYLKAKIKSYESIISTNFQNDELPRKSSLCIYLLVILIDSVFKLGENYYRQSILEECKCTFKEKKISIYINDDF